MTALLPAARWAVGGLAVGAVAGPWAGGAWVVVAAWHLWRPPAPRVVIGIAAGLFGLVPVLWVAGNGSRLGEVTADLVLGNRLPGEVAAAGFALLVTGVWRDVLGRPPAPSGYSEQELPQEEGTP